MTIAATKVSPAIIFTTSSKGGAGKSMFSCLLTDYYRSRNISTAAYDADAKNESLQQFYGQRDVDGYLLDEQDPLKGAPVFNVRDVRQRDIMLDVMDSSAKRIIIDLPGGGAEDVADVLDSTDDFFGAFIDEGFTPIVVMLLSDTQASAASIPATIELFGNKPTYIVARNQFFGPEFPYFDGVMEGGTLRYQGARRALNSVNGTIIDVPELQEETRKAWFRASCKLSEVTNNSTFTRGDKLRLESWRRKFGDAIADSPLALK